MSDSDLADFAEYLQPQTALPVGGSHTLTLPPAAAAARLRHLHEVLDDRTPSRPLLADQTEANAQLREARPGTQPRGV
jgi:hypothetical protein